MVNKPLIRPHFLGVNVALGGVPSVPMKISVDGSEIRRENQFRLVDYPIIYDGFYTSQVVSRISERSTVAFRMFDNMGLFVLWRELFPSIKSIIFISHLGKVTYPPKIVSIKSIISESFGFWNITTWKGTWRIIPGRVSG